MSEENISDRLKLGDKNVLEDGGPAYPCTAPDEKIRKELFENRVKFGLGVFDINRLCSYHPGMSLRDYFAAQIVPGLISSGKFIGNYLDDLNNDKVAKAAYVLADAMIKERNKNG